MKIAMIAQLVEAVPPQRYGGTERVVSVLTEELGKRRHLVTLFASGDSQTSAELVARTPKSLRLHEYDLLPTASILIELPQVYERARRFRQAQRSRRERNCNFRRRCHV